MGINLYEIGRFRPNLKVEYRISKWIWRKMASGGKIQAQREKISHIFPQCWLLYFFWRDNIIFGLREKIWYLPFCLYFLFKFAIIFMKQRSCSVILSLVFSFFVGARVVFIIFFPFRSRTIPGGGVGGGMLSRIFFHIKTPHI